MGRTGRLRSAIRAAFPVTVPVLTGYVCLGLAYGVLMAAGGYGPLWSVLMSAIGFCGSMQYAVIPILAVGFEPLQALLLTLMVNARHILYGLSMLERYRGLGWARFPLIYTLSDETFSLVSTLDPPEGVERRDFFLGISLLDYSYWVGGTALGGLLGSVLSFNTTGLDFALTALFVVLFLEQWKERERRPAGITGIACTAVSLAVFGADNLVIPAMIMILAILLGGRKLKCA